MTRHTSAPVCAALGWALACASGPVAPADRARCESGEGQACYRVAFAVEDVAGEPAEAIPWYEKGCDLEYAEACNDGAALLARMADGPRAVALYRKSCDLGDRLGCRELGHMLLRGDAAARAEGLEALGWACEAGDAEACAAVRRLGE